MFEAIAFYLFAALTIGMFTITVMTSQALYALTAMAAGMIFISAFFFMLGADFLGVVQTFAVNKRVTFRHDGAAARSAWRYVASYGACYVLNLGAMIWFVDKLEFPHRTVQGVAIVTIAALLFLLQKFWVFAPIDAAAPAPCEESRNV